MATRAKRPEVVIEEPDDEQLDHDAQTDTLTGAIPEGELALARSVASKMGWKPKEEWTRDPDKFVDAPEFLENTPKVLAELKERGERAARAAAAAIEDERARKVEEATRVIRESDDPKQREAAAQELQQPTGPLPQTAAWMEKNPWFEIDPAAKKIAANAILRAHAVGLSIEDQLLAGEEAAKREFPHYFANGTEQRLSDVRRQAPNPPRVQDGSRAAGNGAPKEKTFADVPRADRDAFNGNLLKHFMANGLTQEQAQARYANSYWKAPPADPSERPAEMWPSKPQSNVWAKQRGNR